MKKKFIAIAGSTVLVLSSITGCGTSDINTTTDGNTEIGTYVFSNSTITAQVTKINGTEVTFQEGLYETPEQGSMTPPEKPEGGAGEMRGEVPPEKPKGGAGEMSGETPPEKPEGGAGEMMRGTFIPANSMPFTLDLEEKVLQTLNEEDIVSIEFGPYMEVKSLEIVESSQMSQGMPGGFGGSGQVTQGSTAYEITEDENNASYASDGANENAARVTGKTVILDQVTLNKTGDASNTEDADFYGENAGLLATDGAQVTINGGSFETDAAGGNAIFSYGKGTVVTVSDASIYTKKNNSGGIQTTGGGKTVASNLNITTEGGSAAAIRSDRGGGKVEVTGGTYTTNGLGSPAIYSTAEIEVKNATLTANHSEALVIEGKNSIELKDCDVSGNMTQSTGGANDNLHAVMIYQSMSGDAEMGTASFEMEGGTLTGLNGDLIYVTNTSCTIELTNVWLKPANGTILNVSGNDAGRGWGTVGKNGGTVVMECEEQNLIGNILVDEISSLDLILDDGSYFAGTINPEGTSGLVDLKLSDDSTWKLTGDAYLNSFDGNVGNIITCGYHVYVNGNILK